MKLMTSEFTIKPNKSLKCMKAVKPAKEPKIAFENKFESLKTTKSNTISPQVSLSKINTPYYSLKSGVASTFGTRKSSLNPIQVSSTKNSQRDFLLSPSQSKPKVCKKEIKLPISSFKGGVSRNINKYLTTANSVTSINKVTSVHKFQPNATTSGSGISKKLKIIKNELRNSHDTAKYEDKIK